MIHDIGFTGTRNGMSEYQKEVLEVFLSSLKDKYKYIVFHHGDCKGADEQAHNIARNLGYKQIIHPPNVYKYRAFCKGFFDIKEEKSYLERNKDIVNESQYLIATPYTDKEVLRSGTWSTIRYATKQGKKVLRIKRNQTKGDIK